MGMIGISEGAIPFAAADPVRVIPAIVAGGIVGNVTGFMMHSINHAPWGGWIVLPVVEGKMGYILGTILGALTTALVVNLLKKPVTDEEEIATPDGGYEVIEAEGEAEVLAITACPSGVAHTFLAAKSLQKAAAKAGIKLKVETQGANGIITWPTPAASSWPMTWPSSTGIASPISTSSMSKRRMLSTIQMDCWPAPWQAAAR